MWDTWPLYGEGREQIYWRCDRPFTTHSLYEWNSPEMPASNHQDVIGAGKWDPWMSDCPRERWTMEMLTLDFAGRVFVSGLGLGVIACILDGRPDVDEVVVLERERDVAELVWRHLGLRKTRLVVDDAYAWAAKTTERFDYALLDTWPVAYSLAISRWIAPAREATERIVPAGQSNIRCWAEDFCRDMLAGKTSNGAGQSSVGIAA